MSGFFDCWAMPIICAILAFAAPWPVAPFCGIAAGMLIVGAMIERGGTVWQLKPEYDKNGNRIVSEDRDW